MNSANHIANKLHSSRALRDALLAACAFAGRGYDRPETGFPIHD